MSFQIWQQVTKKSLTVNFFFCLYSRELTSGHSLQRDSNRESLVPECKSLTTKLRALEENLSQIIYVFSSSCLRICLHKLLFAKYLQDRHFKRTKHLTVISPDLLAIQENKITEYIENARYQALTQNELKEREAVCQRIERILNDGGLASQCFNNFFPILFHFVFSILI